MSLKAKMAKAFAAAKRADENMARNLEQPPRGSQALAPDSFTKRVRVKTWNVNGFFGLTVNGSYTKNAHILMLTGGAYTLEPSRRYRELAEYFALKKHMKVTIFQYPLAPEYTAQAVHSYLLEAYRRLLREYPEDEFFLFGDFSGGGLALAFLQELRDGGSLPLPVRTAVISPWLDVSLENPKIKLVKKNDPILPVEALKEAGLRYAGPLGPTHPLVSPFYGDWNYLGQLLIFSGTEEILTPDCELLAERSAQLEGTKLIYKKGAGMVHDWIMIPCRETDATLDLISMFFLEEALEF